MGTTLTKLDLIALSASGNAAEKLRDWLENLREDVAAGMGGGDATVFHKTTLDGSLESNANATDLATVIVLVNSLRAKLITHFASEGAQGVHMNASAQVFTEPAASDQTTANDLLNDMKTIYNAHLTESGVHVNNDGTNDVTSPNATDLGTSITLVNEIKADYNAHIIAIMATPLVQL